jgi:hypothetical protein
VARIIALLLLLVSIFSSFWAIRPLDDVDIFNQIVLGRWFPEHIRLTSNEPPFQVFLGWLAQLLFAAIDQLFGLPGVKGINIALLALSFFLIGIWHTRTGDEGSPARISVFALTSGLTSAFLVSASNTSARPQSIAYVFFCALLVVLSSWRTSRSHTCYRLAVLYILLTVWQNCHPSILLAAPVLACCSVRSKADLLYFLPLSLAVLSTPDGWSIFPLSAANAEISRHFLGVSEWMPPWHPSVQRAMYGFWAILSITSLMVITALVKGRKLPAIPSLLSLCFLPAALYSCRFGVFWGFVNAPLFGELLAALWPGTLAKMPVARLNMPSLLLGTIIALVTTAFIGRSHLTPSVPIEAFKELKKSVNEARIFNYREFGGSLEYAGYPGWTPFIDGRLYLYPPEVWHQYYNISFALSRESLPATLKHFDLLVLSPDFQRPLVSALREKIVPGRFLTDTEKLVIFQIAR